jgi:hypothetical protein
LIYGLIFGCLTPLSTIFQFDILWAVSFIGGVPGENAYVLLNLISVADLPGLTCTLHDMDEIKLVYNC